MSGSVGLKIVKNGLVFYFDAGNRKSYIGSGLTCSDLTNNIYGTLTNGPSFSSANNGSIAFDGINNYIDFGNILNLTSNFTLSTTFNMVDTTLGVQTIIGKQEAGGYGIEVNGSIVANSIAAIFYINGGYRAVSDPISNYKNNVFADISITYDGNTFLYYRNGSQVATTSYSGVVTTVSVPFSIGTNPSPNPSLNGNFLKGKVADVRIYNRVLSTAEVLQNYNATKFRFN
jgi:hypothetical protein